MADEAIRSRDGDSWTSSSYDPRLRFAQNRAGSSASRPADTRPAGSSRRIRVVRSLLIGLVLTIVTVVAGELTFQHVIAPNLSITTVRLDGDAVLSREQLLELTGLSRSMLYLHVDVHEIEQRLLSVPAVRSAQVRTQFPDTLIVDMQARTPLFVVDVVTANGVVPVVGDQDGVLFREAAAGELSLPAISGIQFRNFMPGDSLPADLNLLFQDLQILRREYMELFGLISEVRIVPVGRRFETVLYPLTARIPVRLDARARPATYEQAFRIVSFVRAEYGEDNVSEVDLRGQDVVYTLRGEG